MEVAAFNPRLYTLRQFGLVDFFKPDQFSSNVQRLPCALRREVENALDLFTSSMGEFFRFSKIAATGRAYRETPPRR
jgi:hypothetical protein